jgi:hypothetical protein
MSIIFGDYTPPKRETKKGDFSLGIFFDGTNNNKNNTDAKADYDKKRKGTQLTPEEQRAADAYAKYGKKDVTTSYHNDWSNVARLWSCYPAKSGIYIDGIGTETEKDDSVMGGGFGTDYTGIPKRVASGCRSIAEKIRGKKNKSEKIKIPRLTIDVFGFSRGAAAARSFVYEAGRPQYWDEYNEMRRKGGYLGQVFKENNIEVDLIDVRFLGLFDTVSSYSERFSANPDFSNDVWELHLNDIGKAKNVLHFTAMDEHRENFSLTNIHIGLQKMLPGVHSDIGGSYNDGIEVVGEIETKVLRHSFDSLKKKLTDQFWYTENQLEEVEERYGYFSLKGTRDLKKTYSYIPLHFMGEIAESKDVPFDTKTLENKKYKISDDPLLVRVKVRLRKYVYKDAQSYTFKWYDDIHKKYKGVKEGDEKYADYEEELQEQKDLRNLRQNYLHWSANKEGIGMDPTSDRIRKTY